MDSIDRLITPARPYLQTVTSNLPKPLADFGLSLLGQKCYRSLVLNLDVRSSNSACLSLAVSKALGVAIISASSIVKIPQLLKLLNSQSAAGVSFLSILLETISYVITLGYNVRHGFPFSTYGETALITVQNVAIAVAILVFSGRASAAAVFIAGLAIAGYALFSPDSMINAQQLGYLQAGAGVLGIAAKVPQIYTVWHQGGTGQLSAFAVFNYLAGSATRIFTTLQEVDDKLILYGFVAGFALNAVLAGQMVYYWNDKTTDKQGKSRQQRADIAVSKTSESTKKRATRRRAA
jgi:mannose-P-dolichol utilization defect protein 1